MKSNDAPTGGDLKYPQIVKAIAETPWAIVPERLAAIVELVSYRAAGNQLTAEEIRERIGAGPARKPSYSAGAVAVLPLYGVLVPRADMFTKISGGTSLTGFMDSFQQALSDPEVDAILIDVDSPGGSTDLTPEAAQMVRDGRSTKPVWAIANTDANSAAYWIASQASELVVTPSGHVGSIGVFAAHEDISALQEMAGVKTTLVSAGKYKTENSPFEPLSDDARAAIQARVDEFYGMFVTAVARGRGVSVDDVRNGFAEGRVATAKQALTWGMVDRVETFPSTLRQLARASAPDAGNSQRADTEFSTSFVDEATAARDAALALVDRARSLAELRQEGRLTAAKRDQLSALAASLDEAHDAVDELLAESDPNRHADAALRERARFERTRADLQGDTK